MISSAERFILDANGQMLAVILPIEEYRALRALVQELYARQQQSPSASPSLPNLPAPLVETLMTEVTQHP